MPHLGRHADEYYIFVLDALDKIAQGDVEVLLELIQELQRYIMLHPEMFAKNYWR